MARLKWMGWDTRTRWFDGDGDLFVFSGFTVGETHYEHEFTQAWHDLIEERGRVIHDRLIVDNV